MGRFIKGILASIGACVVILAIGTMVFIAIYKRQEEVPERTVLMLQFSPQLAEHRNKPTFPLLPLSEDYDSLDEIVEALDRASQDDRVIGVVARLDHVAMGIAQAQEIRAAIMRFREVGRPQGKFAIAHSDTFGELGPGTVQYYLATAFDEIWMQPIGILSLTGLFMEVPFARKALDKLHLQPRISKRKEYKSTPESLTENDFTASHKEELETVLTSLKSQIMREIASSREMTPEEVSEAMDQAPLLDMQAHKLGLIDRIGYLDELEKTIDKNEEGDFTFLSLYKYLKLSQKPEIKAGEPKIALIYGVGEIRRDRGSDSGLLGAEIMGSDQVAKAFREATEDPDVKAIIFRINSGGGSAVASETIWRAIIKAKEAGKAVIISMSDYAASGGYWIAAHATQIIAHPGTITGSIGVFGGKIVTRDLWEELGVHWGEVHKGANAAMWLNTQDYSQQEWSRLQAWLDQVYAVFIKKVAEGRKLSLDHVEQIAKGRIWTGEDALKFGLVDKLGDLKAAIELAKTEIHMQDKVIPIQVFPEPKTLFERLIDFVFDEGDEGGEQLHLSILGSVPAVNGFLNLVKTLKKLFFTEQNILTMPIQEVK